MSATKGTGVAGVIAKYVQEHPDQDFTAQAVVDTMPAHLKAKYLNPRQTVSSQLSLSYTQGALQRVADGVYRSTSRPQPALIVDLPPAEERAETVDIGTPAVVEPADQPRPEPQPRTARKGRSGRPDGDAVRLVTQAAEILDELGWQFKLLREGNTVTISWERDQ